MVTTLQPDNLQSFRMANSLLGTVQPVFGTNFSEVLEKKVLEEETKLKGKVSENVTEGTTTTKKKKVKTKEGLLDASQLIRNDNRQGLQGTQSTYKLLGKLRDKKQAEEDSDSQNGLLGQALTHVNNAAGQALVQPIFDQAKKQMSKAKVLENWERLAPSVTEDVMKKAIRIDIPLVNDIQALVLRLNPDKTISASILGSQIMSDMLRQNKDKLDRNLRHLNLQLRELNTYYTEIEFNNEAGTKKKKRQKSNKPMIDSLS